MLLSCPLGWFHSLVCSFTSQSLGTGHVPGPVWASRAPQWWAVTDLVHLVPPPRHLLLLGFSGLTLVCLPLLACKTPRRHSALRSAAAHLPSALGSV